MTQKEWCEKYCGNDHYPCWQRINKEKKEKQLQKKKDCDNIVLQSDRGKQQ